MRLRGIFSGFGGIEYGAACACAWVVVLGFGRGVLGFGGRLPCVGPSMGCVVRGNVGPVGRREAVDVVVGFGVSHPARVLLPSTPPPLFSLFARLFPRLLPPPSPPLAASSRPPRWSTLLVRSLSLYPGGPPFQLFGSSPLCSRSIPRISLGRNCSAPLSPVL